MALLNVDAAIPPHMWAMVRLLVITKSSLSLENARSLLSPPSLITGNKQDKTFDQTVRTLRELGIVSGIKDDELTLDASARHLDGQDFNAFRRVLRTAVLAPTRNTGLADSADTKGPRDLTRTLAWFLSQDPMSKPVTWRNAQLEQSASLVPDVGDPSRNDTRWNRFAHWAPVLGLGASPIIPVAGAGPLCPDCTAAVKQTVGALWKVGDDINAVDFVRAIRAELPVLPGGSYSEGLGIPGPGEASVDAALSFALLRGHDEGWLSLERDADARRFVSVIDPEQPNRRVSDVIIMEEPRG